jgi:streptogramin lyase
LHFLDLGLGGFAIWVYQEGDPAGLRDVWVSDWGTNAILRFDPKAEKVESFSLPDFYASVRQLAGRKGEVWGAESRADKLFVLKSD